MSATPTSSAMRSIGGALGGAQHDPGTHHRPLLARRGTHDGLEHLAIGIRDRQRRSRRMSHVPHGSEPRTYRLDISGTRH